MADLQQSVSGRKGIVEDRIVREVAHGKVVDLVNRAGVARPRCIDPFHINAPRKHASTLNDARLQSEETARRIHAIDSEVTKRIPYQSLEALAMMLLLKWFLYALALLLVSWLVPGFHVSGLWPALIAALAIGLLNATVGLFLKIITFPLTIVTLGLFLLVINSLMILLASDIVRGFYVRGFIPAFWGAVVLAILGMVIKGVTKKD
jgi:putative membrane protein